MYLTKEGERLATRLHITRTRQSVLPEGSAASAVLNNAGVAIPRYSPQSARYQRSVATNLIIWGLLIGTIV